MLPVERQEPAEWKVVDLESPVVDLEATYNEKKAASDLPVDRNMETMEVTVIPLSRPIHEAWFSRESLVYSEEGYDEDDDKDDDEEPTLPTQVTVWCVGDDCGRAQCPPNQNLRGGFGILAVFVTARLGVGYLKEVVVPLTKL